MINKDGHDFIVMAVFVSIAPVLPAYSLYLA